MVTILCLNPFLTYTNPEPNPNPNKYPNTNSNPNTNPIPTHRSFGIDFCRIYCVLAFGNARQNKPTFNRPHWAIFFWFCGPNCDLASDFENYNIRRLYKGSIYILLYFR